MSRGTNRTRVNGRRRSPTPPPPEGMGGDNLGDYTNEDNSAGGQVSLAHELAAAMMPQPTTSRLLAEEFGLEFEDGAQDEGPHANGDLDEEDEEHLKTPHDSPHHSRTPLTIVDSINDQRPSLDPFTTLTQDMEHMDTFLSQLRHLDGDHSSATHEPPLEKAASELIRKLNEAIRDREDQVRQLLELEREFRRISSEVGGGDVLGALDELETVEGLLEENQRSPHVSRHSRLSSVAETEEEDWEKGHGSRQASLSNDDVASPVSASLTGNELATTSSAIPHVARFRTDTKSLANTLTSLSEQTQVNGAVAAEAGRKIRALKNKLGGWQSDWESAERSRLLIENWESTGEAARRIGAEKLKDEQINAFQAALDEAATQTQLIMAIS